MSPKVVSESAAIAAMLPLRTTGCGHNRCFLFSGNLQLEILPTAAVAMSAQTLGRQLRCLPASRIHQRNVGFW